MICCVSLMALCRFTVRDVAFADLGDARYRLHAFIDEEETPAAKETVERLATAIFLDSNVDWEVVSFGGEEEHPAEHYLAELQVQEFPTAVVVSPAGDALAVPLTAADKGFDELGSQALGSVVSSPVRQKILDSVLGRFAVVVLVQGLDTTQNARAEAVVRQSFAELEKVFDKMPKAVGDLPRLLVVPSAERAAERVLLWSLNMDVDSPLAATAVIFGRGRRVGPVLEGDGITAMAMSRILDNVGQSCECELDLSWMRGPRLPLRWDAGMRAQAPRLLGFDPENPLVRAEIRGILARGEGRSGQGKGDADGLLGYGEEMISASDESLPPPSSTEDDPGDPSINMALLALAGLLLISVVAGVVVMMRSSR